MRTLVAALLPAFPLESGASVSPPAEGRAWLVAVHDAPGQVASTLRLD